MHQCLNALEKYLNETSSPHDPLVRSYLTHYQFEAIHPFRDGNGRIGRALLSLTTYEWCDLHLPWLYMSAYFERYKEEYIDKLFRVSTHGDWDRWVEFCSRGMAAQSRDGIRRGRELMGRGGPPPPGGGLTGSLPRGVLLQAVVERPHADAEFAGGLLAIAIVPLQGVEDAPLLQVGQCSR